MGAITYPCCDLSYYMVIGGSESCQCDNYQHPQWPLSHRCEDPCISVAILWKNGPDQNLNCLLIMKWQMLVQIKICWPLLYWIYSKKHENKIACSYFSKMIYGLITSNLTSRKTRSCLFFTRNTMAADVLVTGRPQLWYWLNLPKIFPFQH